MKLQEMVNIQYHPLKLIGSGGSGEVYLVRERSTGREFALKDSKLKRITKTRQRTKENEDIIGEGCELLKYLRHPGIPRLHDFLSEGNRRIVIMEYIEGRNLFDEAIKRGGIEEEHLINMLVDLCDILIYLHDRRQPIIYRDIKPSNIMLGRNGSISLIDFDSAVIEGSDYISEGTGYYASPEHFSGRVDQRSDIYSLGKTALRLARNIRGMPISDGFISIMKKATMIDPKLRYQNVYELREAITDMKMKEKK